jgi:hypothetical protein
MTMKASGPIAFLRVPFVLGVLLAAFGPPAALAQSFTITAQAFNDAFYGGTTEVQYKVTGIPADGTLVVSCQYAGSPTFQSQNKLPICGVGPIAGIAVTTGQSTAGTISVVPWGTPIPVSLHDTPASRSRAPASGLLLAGALLLGFTLRRKGRHWFSLILVAAGTLAIAAGLSACGTNSNGPTPGVYPYTVTATDEFSGPTPLGQAVSTTVMVLVP